LLEISTHSTEKQVVISQFRHEGRQCYGGGYTHFAHKHYRSCVVNSGIVIATAPAFRALASVLNTPCPHAKTHFHGQDQIVLNFNLYSGGLAKFEALRKMVVQSRNGTGVVNNMRYNLLEQRERLRQWRLDFRWPDQLPFVQLNADGETPRRLCCTSTTTTDISRS
jgi:hypothetical protein